MTHRILSIALPGLCVLALSACGGGGTESLASAPPPVSAPAPTPVPAPAPTPAPVTEPLAKQLFAEPLYNSAFAVAGKGWTHEAVPNSSAGISYATNIRDADDFSITYDNASGAYTVTRPGAGSQLIISGEGSIAADYEYVKLAQFYGSQPVNNNLETQAYGAFAVAQPTRPADMPTTGSAHFSGHLVGWFAGDAGASWLGGQVNLDVDFARALLSGEITAHLACLMGCSASPVTYTMADTHFTRGDPAFSGSLTTPGAPSAGSFSGTFAGPGATEAMARVRFPYYHQDYRQWVDFGGVIVGKRE